MVAIFGKVLLSLSLRLRREGTGYYLNAWILIFQTVFCQAGKYEVVDPSRHLVLWCCGAYPCILMFAVVDGFPPYLR